MKRYIRSAFEMHTSGCSFDFDLGTTYDAKYVEDCVTDIFADMGLEVIGIDFRSVDYPRNKKYSQCGVDFQWKGNYSSSEIEDALIDFIDDEGGNFFGIDFYSLED